MSAVESGERYHTLDAMRGIAALLVAAYHLQQRWYGNTIAGYLAVDIFFVLSGFVIALNYTGRFAHNLTLARFFELRLIRLFPLYALGLMLGLAKLATGHVLHIPPAGSVGNLSCAAAFGAAMLPDPCSPELFPLNGPSWSLFFELGINLAFGLILWRSSSALLVALMIASAVSLVCHVSPPDYFNVGWSWHNFSGGLYRTILSFCAGIMLFRILPADRRTTSLAALLPIIAMAVLIGSVAAFGRYRIGVETFTVIVAFPAMVFAGCLFEVPNRMVRRAFGFLGDLSYPIYSIHWPLIAIMVTLAARFHLPASLSIALFLIVLIPLAYLAGKIDAIVRGRISAALKLRRARTVQIA